jgi:hypothetical protein
MSPKENPPRTPPSPRPGQPAKPDKDWQEQDDFLEEALKESFPASDPIAPGHVPPSKDPKR